jgi:hypothetical protein
MQKTAIEEAAMRLDGVEIKVSLSDHQVTRALEVLELGGNGQPRRIDFIEDTTVGSSSPCSTRASSSESARSTTETTTPP